MSDHLPECPWADRGFAFPCICDRLRACEQRVQEEERALIAVERTTLAELNAEYRKGLDAAREAVAGLPLTGGWTTPDGVIHEISREDALAAIDALSENPDHLPVSENPNDAR